jgi:hypothetical protein
MWLKMSKLTFREQSLIAAGTRALYIHCISSIHTKLYVRFPNGNKDAFRNGGLFTFQPPDVALTREYFIEFCRRESLKLRVCQIYICTGNVLSLDELVNTVRLE